MDPMEKRIELERRGRPIEEIEDLILDNCRGSQISGLTDEFVNLQSLSLINVGLTTLKGFPNLPSLRKLELSDNRISNGLNYMQGCPKLCYLNLSGNKIKDIPSLEPLKELKKLRNLDLFNCEVTNQTDYREAVFEILPDILFLDGYDRDNQEIEDDDDENDDDEESSGSEDGDRLVNLDRRQLEGDEDDEDDNDEDDDSEGGEGGAEEGDGEEHEEDHDKGTKRKHDDDNDEDD